MLWSKKSPRDIRQEMENLVRELKDISKPESSKAKIVSRGGAVLALINDAKADMKLEAERIKTFPWIDQRFDASIDKLVSNEHEVLVRLEKEMLDLISMAASSESEEHLKVLRELISGEADTLNERDEATKKSINDMEARTLTERLKTASVAPLGLQTYDGTRWSDIGRVVCQLGGWIINTSGKHKQAAMFPGEKKVSLSQDVSAERLAQEMHPLLGYLGARKQLSTKKLKDALRSGDIHAAA